MDNPSNDSTPTDRELLAVVAPPKAWADMTDEELDALASGMVDAMFGAADDAHHGGPGVTCTNRR